MSNKKTVWKRQQIKGNLNLVLTNMVFKALSLAGIFLLAIKTVELNILFLNSLDLVDTHGGNILLIFFLFLALTVKALEHFKDSGGRSSPRVKQWQRCL